MTAGVLSMDKEERASMTEEAKTISKQTSVTVGLALVIGAAIMAWAIRDAVWKTQVETRLDGIDDKIGSINTDAKEARSEAASLLDASQADRWRGVEMENWCLRFQIANPGISVPDPRAQGQNIIGHPPRNP